MKQIDWTRQTQQHNDDSEKEHVIKQRQKIAAYKITPESIYPDTYLNGKQYRKSDRKIYVARKTYNLLN